MGSYDSAQKLLESSFYREFVGSDEGDYTFNFNTEYEYMFMVGTWRTKDYSDSVGRWYPPEGDVKTLKFYQLFGAEILWQQVQNIYR